METTTTETPHYTFGASGAKTWRGCKGSPNYVAQEKAKGNIPERNDTSYSTEGTEAHKWADDYLTGKTTVGEIPPNFYEHLQGYFTLAADLANSVGSGECIVMNEQRVPYWYNPEQAGTLDYGVVAEDASELVILDLKYGAGVYVAAKDNDQGAIYAISLMRKLEAEGYVFKDDTTVKIYIYQPRHHSFTGEAELWQLTYVELLDIALDIEADYHVAKVAPPSNLTPSQEACQFCDARVVCRERVVEMFDSTPIEINPLVPTNQGGDMLLPPMGELNDAARVAIFENYKKIEKWMKDVVADSLDQIEQGNPIEGLKTVDGKQGNRGWGDNEADVEKLLRKIPATDRYKPRRVLSPAQVEKVLKNIGKPLKDQSTKFRNRWEALIFRKPSTPSLALESDAKPARISHPLQFDEQPTTIEVETEPVVGEEDCF